MESYFCINYFSAFHLLLEQSSMLKGFAWIWFSWLGMLSMTETSNQHENTKKCVVIRENPPPGVPTLEDQSTENIWSFSSLGCL